MFKNSSFTDVIGSYNNEIVNFPSALIELMMLSAELNFERIWFLSYEVTQYLMMPHSGFEEINGSKTKPLIEVICSI